MYQVIGSTRTRTFRVLWMLEELGEPYEHLPHPPRSDEVKALNPSGKVPVLIDEGAAITDSTAILTYLADKHRRFTFPAGSIDRARQDALTHSLLDEFDAVLWTAARHSFILPEEKRLPDVKDSLRWEFHRNQERLAERMGDGPYLMGEAFTVPDILLTHCLNWAMAAKFPVEEPALIAYGKQVRSRPAYQRVAEMA